MLFERWKRCKNRYHKDFSLNTSHMNSGFNWFRDLKSSTYKDIPKVERFLCRENFARSGENHHINVSQI